VSAGASRYETILKLASGGMATVWIGNVRGALGFRQLVAIKKPHPHLLSDPGFRGELVAEARLASMIHHANVVDVRDVEIEGESISLVMDYIEGASLGDLLVASARRDERLPPRAVIRIILDACAGLHAAHELVDEKGRPVGLVHRDVSPQNILVGSDGISRVADFGVAKFARKNMQSTSEGSLKGKLAYMAPEYVRAEGIDRRFDVFALGIVLWESLAGKRCFRGENEPDTLMRLLEHTPEPVSTFDAKLAPLDAVVACALSKNREERFNNAAAMATALEASAITAGLLAGHGEVARAVKYLVGPAIEERRTLVRAKQANEPSVASLMGVPPIVVPTNPPPAANAATLLDAAPPTGAVAPTVTSPAAATPKQGGGMTLAAASAVPTTRPMTPRMDPNAQVHAHGHAQSPYGAPPVPTTLASPHAMHAALPITGSGPTAISPPFAAPAVAQAIPNTTLRSDTNQNDKDGTHGALDPVDVPGLPSQASRRWTLPLVLVAALVAIAGGAFAVMGTHKTADTTTTQGSSAPTTTASATAVAPATSAPVTSSASVAIIASAPVATAAKGPRPKAPPQTQSAAPPAPVPSPAPSPTLAPSPAPTPTPTPEPTPTGKKPPPNPYGNN
jgi:eukaryotic-like serine/threonine-protein kinase